MEDITTHKSVHHEENERGKTKWIKIICGVSSALCFGLGLRVARNQAAPLRPGELSRRSLLSGSGLAMHALGVATVISVSGYVLMLVAVSELLGVNTWKQFGQQMTNLFGDRFRIARGTSEGMDQLRELIERAELEGKSDTEMTAKANFALSEKHFDEAISEMTKN
ncbi:hypothetical protein niasHS_017656 [Heterodera schachtii]|uniref:Transmembrane protein 242 n=2 Tax=Heterodera TaxID=34509 RepID=A0ABD2HXN9_HETSC